MSDYLKLKKSTLIDCADSIMEDILAECSDRDLFDIDCFDGGISDEIRNEFSSIIVKAILNETQ